MKTHNLDPKNLRAAMGRKFNCLHAIGEKIRKCWVSAMTWIIVLERPNRLHLLERIVMGW